MTGELLAFAAMVMFATNVLVTKAASNRLDVGTGFAISIAVNLLFAAFAFAIELALRSETFQWDLHGVVLFMLAGAFATYLGRFFFFGAIARLGPAKASLFHVSSPAFAAIIAWLFLAETLPLPKVLAIVATIAGLLLVSTPPGLCARDSFRRNANRTPKARAGVGKRGLRPASPSASPPLSLTRLAMFSAVHRFVSGTSLWLELCLAPSRRSRCTSSSGRGTGRSSVSCGPPTAQASGSMPSVAS